MPNSHTNQPAAASSPEEQHKPVSNAPSLIRFAALIVGLMVLAYVLMKALSVVWPE